MTHDRRQTGFRRLSILLYVHLILMSITNLQNYLGDETTTFCQSISVPSALFSFFLAANR